MCPVSFSSVGRGGVRSKSGWWTLTRYDRPGSVGTTVCPHRSGRGRFRPLSSNPLVGGAITHTGATSGTLALESKLLIHSVYTPSRRSDSVPFDV